MLCVCFKEQLEAQLEQELMVAMEAVLVASCGCRQGAALTATFPTPFLGKLSSDVETSTVIP
jgi:hypothetical protein